MKYLALLIMFISSTALAGRFEVLSFGKPFSLYLLDSTTGRIWMNVCGSYPDGSINCDYRYWAPEDIIGITVTKEKASQNLKNTEGPWKKFDPDQYLKDHPNPAPSVDPDYKEYQDYLKKKN